MSVGLHVQVCSSLSVRGRADEARGARPGAAALPEQTQAHAACLDQNTLRFPTLHDVRLVVVWFDDTIFPPPRPSKTLQIHPKCLLFIHTPLV